MVMCLDSPTAPLLFDTAFLSKLEQLHLLSKKLLRSQHRAERPSRQIGSSLEFADYRNYAPGDDLRGVDWNIYGRLEKLSVKLFEQEQDLPVYLLVDASESMRWVPGATSPKDAHAPRSKFVQVRRTAASLAYVALANLDRVGIQWFGSQLGPQLAMTRGRSQFHKVLDFLQTAPPRPGPTCLRGSARTRPPRCNGAAFAQVSGPVTRPLAGSGSASYPAKNGSGGQSPKCWPNALHQTS
jgi:uncharacterized protein (DUF58 family)